MGRDGDIGRLEGRERTGILMTDIGPRYVYSAMTWETILVAARPLSYYPFISTPTLRPLAILKCWLVKPTARACTTDDLRQHKLNNGWKPPRKNPMMTASHTDIRKRKPFRNWHVYYGTYATEKNSLGYLYSINLILLLMHSAFQKKERNIKHIKNKKQMYLTAKQASAFFYNFFLNFT